ncbi:ABC transporter substrate-binding protein [Novosphingobium sp. MMS21-SN21R]|uniref:ABC transporter substrate-binding protein n=1 Tax=Novosphingobium sp. MMS21-SN21R TaxID=2969298 RepID=UPI002886A758|nr:ABC transporter substrate-binding protein [Novosphingobium sp. MMS21-SN21R]MDT0510241.1 ABC transporter substrate-binding protein [Novosphingobium sp. MMS21-SN21R]
MDLRGVRGLRTERTLSSEQQFEQLRSGTIDAAVTAIDNVITWNEKAPEARFRAIAQVERTTELVLVARPGITAISDLAGKTLLVDAPANGFVVALRAMLIEAGIDETCCMLAPAGGVTERLDALLAGTGDATLLGPPFYHAAIAQGCNVVGSVQASWPDFPGQGLVVNTARLAASRDDCILSQLTELLGAMDIARRSILSKPAEAVDIVVRSGVPVGAASAMLAAVSDTFQPDADGMKRLIQHRATVWPTRPPLVHADLADESVLAMLQAANGKG